VQNEFQSSLVCDDYAGYKALFKPNSVNQAAIQEAGC
jgi:hypothetical protein